MRSDTKFAVATAPKRDSRHWTQGEVTWAEVLAWADNPADHKESGNYLLGTLEPTTVIHDKKRPDDRCTDMHRRKSAVVSRSALTLDIDHPEPGFAESFDLTWGTAALLHTTYSSSPDALRYRLIIPTDREMTPDEYITACRAVMQQLGVDQFDRSTSEPERYMFRPSAQERGWFSALVVDGEPARVDGLLSGFEEDLSTKPLVAPGRNKRDPFAIEGVVGAFNRAYEDWDLLIEVYELPYEKVDDDRYQLVGARSQAGMGPVRDVVGFVYSHHANDPAFGRTCSAFDLVRLHRFGELDEELPEQTPINKLPSHLAMLDEASTDHRVTAELVGVDFAEDMEDDVAAPNDWKLGLRLAPRSGKFVDCVANWDLVSAHDPVLALLVYNELTLGPEASGDLPWRTVTSRNATFSNTDRWEMVYYVEREYNIRVTRAFMDSLVDTQAVRRPVNPVRDYLSSLRWDGVERLEESLPGVRPDASSRLIARKVLVAAVARMYEPGCKWDHTLVLYGTEGVGKTYWIERMSRGWTSSLGRIDNKDTLLTMQRSWIVVADEGHSLRKADHDAQKEFLTRTSDVFRLPYERETVVHPRHCVIWSTTNDETFLRRQEGNRRFLIVHCQDKVDFDALTDAYVDQVWAEAVHAYENGEQLFLGEVEARAMAAERERFVEEDALGGLVAEFLDTLVPEDYWEMTVEARNAWRFDLAQGFTAPGTMQLDRICSTQVWVEGMGRKLGDHRRTDLLDINEAIKRQPDWESLPERQRIPGYGPQMTFIRKDLI